jgi:prepilin-type N-terminal cleavage/methylation domain-containing protein
MNHATHSYIRSTKPSHRDGASRRGERGVTLIELMVSVVVGSMLVGFVFDIHGRMSTAFRAQNNIGSLQQGIRAANELMARDIRQAGFMMPDGAFVSSAFNPATSPVVQIDTNGNKFVPGFSVFNNPEGRGDDQMQPDRVHVFYADPDPTYQTVVVGDVTPTSVGVITSSLFQPGELVLLARQDPTPHPHPLGGNLPMVTKYFACVVEVTGNLGTSPGGHDQLFFDASPFNTAANEHCFIPTQTAVVDPTAPGVVGKTQVFRLVARAYRIDVSRELMAPLEINVTGGLLNVSGGLTPDWVIMGIGFVDLQITQRVVEEVSDLADPDNDGNPRMDWYSAGGPFPLNAHLTQVGIGLVARTARPVEGVRSTEIPVLYDLASNPPRNNNPLGDAVGPKLLTNPEYSGDHVYRHSYMSVDMRNIGVAF